MDVDTTDTALYNTDESVAFRNHIQSISDLSVDLLQSNVANSCKLTKKTGCIITCSGKDDSHFTRNININIKQTLVIPTKNYIK